MKAKQKILEHDFSFYDLEPQIHNLKSEIYHGLSQTPKQLPAKLFYDEQGSKFFEQITGLKEYYLTSTEMKLLKDYGAAIAAKLGDKVTIIEYGCGSSEKIHHLLEHLSKPQAYIAIDISKKPLLALAQELNNAYPNLEVTALCADFTKPLAISIGSMFPTSRKVAFFPGSSIGNFEPEDTLNFLKLIAQEVGEAGGLLIGVDLKKDPNILNLAYNDSQGVTAQFNLNILTRLQREMGAELEPSQFEHLAFYNEALGRIEMHLKSLVAQEITIKGQKFSFKKGETIHTENSYKYSVTQFQEIAQKAGWQAQTVWTDEAQLFSLQYFELS